jgi:transposase-like protein
MAKKVFTTEQIISKLREAEVLISQGQTVSVACKALGISEQTFYRWRKAYGGLKIDQAQRLRELEQENARLKRLVADLSLDKAILKETLRGKLSARPSDGSSHSHSTRDDLLFCPAPIHARRRHHRRGKITRHTYL